MAETATAAKRSIGRYRLFDAIASGGTAVVHIGRLAGVGGFARTVAIKRLHAYAASDPEFVAMLLDEARLAARVRHPNVAPIFDVVVDEGEVCLVLEHVDGESLARLLKKAVALGERVPVDIARAILLGALYGLQAAHDATGDDGEPLDLVHRDVSPQNVLVGVDGIARVIDFGVAKATARMQTTHDGTIKGKLGYMSPEQLDGKPVDARTDVFAAGVVLWETLVGARLFNATELSDVVRRAVAFDVPPPSARVPGLAPEIDAVVMTALALQPDARFPSAAAMASALARTGPAAPPHEVGAWVRRVGGPELAARSARIAEIERGSMDDVGPSPNREVATSIEQPTSVPHSLPLPPSAEPPPRRLGDLRPVIAAVALGVIVVAGVAAAGRVRRAAVVTPSATSTPPSAEGSAAPPVPTSTVAAPAPSPEVVSPGEAPLPVVALPSATARRSGPPRRHASGAAVPSSGRPAYCSQGKQAFSLGADGIERPRPECL